MASLTNTKIKNTYVSLLKVADNGQLDAALQDITDGAGNVSGIQLNTGGDLTASGTISFGSLKDSGENITITKFVDAADGIGSNDNDTTIPTSAAVKLYVDTNITAQDLDFTTDSGTGAVDLDSQTFSILGTANEIETSGTGQTVTIGLPSSITVDVTGNLTGNVSGNVTGNVTGNLSGNVTGDVTGDLTGNVTATSVLVDGVTATTQSIGDNSTKVATTAYVDAAITAEGLDFAGDSGTGTIDLDSEVFTIAGTANEIETSATGNSLIVGLPSNVTIGNDLTVTTNASVGGTFGVTGTTTITGDLAVDTDTLFVDVSEDRVGINKAVPAVALDVVGDITSSGTVTGTTLTGTLSTAAQPNVTSVGTLSSLAVSGDLTVDTSTLKVDSANNRVGIGGTPTSLLTLQRPSGGADTDIDFSNEVGVGPKAKIRFGGTDEELGFHIQGSEAMRIDTSGNVGINESAPVTTLSLGSGSTGLSFLSASKSINSGKIAVIKQVEVGSGNGHLTFETYAGGAGGAERMRIDSSGRVGIGASSFSTFDKVRITGTNAVANDLVLATPNTAQSRIFFSDTDAEGVGELGYDHSSNAMRIVTNGAERIRILSSGGITFNGDTAAANALDDYEEGSWTPTLLSGTCTGTAYYTKIGRLVNVFGTITHATDGTGATGITITNLPIAADQRALGYSSFTSGLLDAGDTQATVIARYTDAGGSANYLFFASYPGASGIDASRWLSGVAISFNITYIA